MKLNLLFINDVHGYIAPHPELFYDEAGEKVALAGGYAYIAGLVDEIRNENPNTLLFDGGDSLHGTKPIVDSEGGAVVPILNAMKMNALVGHWDFAYGPAHLKNLGKELDFPILGCNVYCEDGFNFFQPTALYKVGNMHIGVIGICAMIVDKVMPEKMGKGLKFTSGVDEVPQYIKKLKDEGADVIVLLSHNGFPQDVALLEEVDGIEICLSAHTHNRLYEAVEVNGANVIQCGCHGAFLGKISLNIENKEIQNFNYELIKITNQLPKSTEVDILVGQVLQPYQELRTRVIGSTTEILHRYNTLNSSMDSFLLESIAHSTKTEIAFCNGWRYGAPIAVGDITEDALYNITGMNPPVSTVEMTGTEIREMLEENLEHTFCNNPFEQMGGYVKRVFGLQINMRIENPKGHRIQEIYFRGSHLDYSEMYKVSFVTTQGIAKKYGQNRQEHNHKAVEAMKAFLKERPVFTPSKVQSFRLV